jgi:plasmid stabilization system protein ParE
MKLRFSPDAVEDLVALRAWLRDKHPQGYGNIVEAIESTIRILADRPQAGRHRATRCSRGDRAALRLHYPYTIIGDTVWILRIYDARRDPAKKLP